ncbi:hypothetical protein HJG60_010114 [Phyllostomus discolor]|uniref:Uncharacterized protein n=1 Tax=Phyllostomus discolor TaxID=89673 RepID=A0A834EMI9_9CHIR|nr:hypothetical protein HJG60_010114 [Phyllostomus discolor]
MNLQTWSSFLRLRPVLTTTHPLWLPVCVWDVFFPVIWPPSLSFYVPQGPRFNSYLSPWTPPVPQLLLWPQEGEQPAPPRPQRASSSDVASETCRSREGPGGHWRDLDPQEGDHTPPQWTRQSPGWVVHPGPDQR